MRLNSKLILATLAALALVLPVTTFATHSPNNTFTGHDIHPGVTKEITAHGVCKRIANNSDLRDASGALVYEEIKTFFIPTKTLAEWNSFINNHPVEIGVAECGGIVTPTPIGSSGSDIYIHYYVGDEPGNFWE